MRRLLISFLSGAALLSAGALDPREIVSQSIANYERDYHAALRYSYIQRDIDSSDGTKKVTVSQVVVVEGLPFEKVISRNGQPLTPSEQKREDEKYQKAVSERSAPGAREKKLAEYEHARSFLKEVPKAFAFKIAGEEMINGRANYVMDCEPNPEYSPVDSKAKMFSHIKAKMWIDKQDLRWTRADATVTAPIAIGWILAKIGQGARISIHQQRVAPNVWMPSELAVNGNARIMMVKNHPIGEDVFFSDYRPLGQVEASQSSASLVHP
jgi:hypothetical protein